MKNRVSAALLMVTTAVAWPHTALAQGDPIAQAHLGLARAYRGLGNIAGAAAEYERADRVSPLHGDVLAEYFWVAFNRRASVTDSLGQRILREQPQKSDVRDALIGLAVTRGDEYTVLKLADEGAAQFNATALWHRRLGESLLRQKEFVRAAGEFQAASGMLDGTQEDRAQAALALTTAGSWVAALAAWHQVPATVRHLRREWDDGWARAVLAVEPATVAATRFESDLAHHSDDQVHTWLFELYMRDGDARVALGITQRIDNPGRNADVWLRRRAAAATAADDVSAARGALERLASAGRATIDDRWLLAATYASSGDAQRTANVLMSLRRAPCDERSLHVLDRLRDSRLLDETVARRPASCVNQDVWLNRVIERRVADGDHVRALAVLDLLEDLRGSSINRTALRGQLLLWTGRPSDAVPLLQRAAAQGSAREVIEALIDAHRANGDSAKAWWLAKQASFHDADGSRRLTYAEIALEAQDPEGARQLLTGSAEVESERGREVLGRVFVMSGQHAEARAVLRGHPALSQRESVATAWLDAIAVTDGLDAALQETERIARPGWVETAARQTLWNERVGRVAAAEAALRSVGASDTGRARTLGVDRLSERLAFASDVANRGRLDEAADAAVSVLRSEARTDTQHRHAIGVLEQVMSAYWTQQNASAARRLAGHIVSFEPSQLSAWLIEAAATVTLDDAIAASRLQEFGEVFAGNRQALLAMAGQVATYAGRVEPKHIDIGLGWIDDLLGSEGHHPDILVTRARLLVAAERWDAALSAVDEALQLRQDQESFRLRAQVLGWSGDWVTALRVYDEYLTRFPDDTGAQREAARIDGWRQAFGKSVRRYTALLKHSGGDPLIDAELRSKHAYYGAQWGAATREYARWTSLDPHDSEAAFERAQVFEAAGEFDRAKDAYASILARVPHRQTSEALQRFRSRTQPGAQFFAASRTANGFDGLALATVHEQGAVLSDDVALGETTRIAASGSRLRIGDTSAVHDGMRATLGLRHIGSARWRFAARAGVLSAAGDSPTLDGIASLWLRLGDAWEMQGTVERVRLAENLPLFLRRATETASSGALTWTPSSDTFVQARIRRAHVFDGNARTGLAIDIRQRVLRGRNELLLLGRSDVTRNTRSTGLYFSPDKFIRSDAGTEWRHWIRSPRFMNDRGSSLGASYFGGVDDRRIAYHSFSGGGEFRMPGSGVLAINAQWVRSRVYTSLGVSVAVQLLGPNSDAVPSWGSGVNYPR